eukprot:jgi/Astpho2/7903/e_gw1.00118.61.1_t
MELEPIYAAEQIKVPSNLGEVLKAYTKEVIRVQPEDLIAFSAEYFGHLASVVEEATDFVPPTVNQIRLAYPQLTPGHLVASHQLQQLLLDLGIHQGTLDKVWKMGQFGKDSKLNPSEVLTLLLTTTTSSFAAVVSGLFDVFGQGGRLDRETFLALLDSLAKWDTSITQPMRSSLKDSLKSIEFLSFADLQQNPAIGDRLTKRNA